MPTRNRTLGLSVSPTEEKLIREVARRSGFESVSPFLRQIVLREVVDRVEELTDEPEDEEEAIA